MNGVAVTLQASEEAEGEEADGQADERHGNTHTSDDGEKKLVDAPIPLHRNRHDRLTFSSTLFIIVGGI